MERHLELADFRRRVAGNYAAVRARGAGAESWEAWREERDGIFAAHPQSPVPEDRREGFPGMAFFPYDPSWRLTATVHPVGAGPSAPAHGGGTSAPDGSFSHVGDVVAVRDGQEIRLPLLWLDAYGGGLFLPFRDATNGDETYGGGRYLLDQPKGADLGVAPDGSLVLDFNFAYHPSCAHDPRWTCPLAPPDARVPIPVRAGEKAP